MCGRASAARWLGRDEAVEDLLEAGPAGVRETVRAVNMMSEDRARFATSRAMKSGTCEEQRTET